jgi:hypothetical protein
MFYVELRMLFEKRELFGKKVEKAKKITFIACVGVMKLM